MNWHVHAVGWMWVWWGALVVGVVAVIWLVVAANRPTGQASGEDDSEALLRRRFADGEITQEEFEHQLSALRRAEPKKHVK